MEKRAFAAQLLVAQSERGRTISHFRQGNPTDARGQVIISHEFSAFQCYRSLWASHVPVPPPPSLNPRGQTLPHLPKQFFLSETLRRSTVAQHPPRRLDGRRRPVFSHLFESPT